LAKTFLPLVAINLIIRHRRILPKRLLVGHVAPRAAANVNFAPDHQSAPSVQSTLNKRFASWTAACDCRFSSSPCHVRFASFQSRVSTETQPPQSSSSPNSQ
jgi:hypothetical protein